MPALQNITGSLGKKIGPLKAWQWGAVIGGGVLLYGVMRGKGFSLAGDAKTTAEADTGISGGSSGTSYNGPGTATGEIYNPPQVQITITPETIEPTATAPASDQVAQLQAQLAKQTAREQERVAGWSAWGEKWKTQAYKNAGNARRATGKKPVTRKKSTPVPAPKRVQRPAQQKRNQTGSRRVTEGLAARKRLTPKVAPKKQHGKKVKK